MSQSPAAGLTGASAAELKTGAGELLLTPAYIVYRKAESSSCVIVHVGLLSLQAPYIYYITLFMHIFMNVKSTSLA